MAIGGFTDLARARLPADHEARQDLDGIRHAADQAALTRQLLAFSRNQPLRPAVVDLGEIVASVEPLLRRVLGEQIRLVVRPADPLWPVVVDPSQMESIVVNLAVNARDAMASGGTLTIETANVELDDDYASGHTEVSPGPYVMLAVSDTGTGMDEATMARIFEPFFTTKSLGQGTGLGLSTVYGTVRQSSGHIWVYSEVGRGTTFKIYLPRTEQPLTTLRQNSTATPAEEQVERALILVAEDEEFVRELIVKALEQRGYSVIAVATGEEALASIDQRGAQISALLTDMVMPGMSGPELYQRARAMRPDLRAIFMSGYTALSMDKGGIPEGVIFLEKPFSLSRLDAAIREVLGD
jgi:CheY-like chemotaxis protein